MHCCDVLCLVLSLCVDVCTFALIFVLYCWSEFVFVHVFYRFPRIFDLLVFCCAFRLFNSWIISICCFTKMRVSPNDSPSPPRSAAVLPLSRSHFSRPLLTRRKFRRTGISQTRFIWTNRKSVRQMHEHRTVSVHWLFITPGPALRN